MLTQAKCHLANLNTVADLGEAESRWHFDHNSAATSHGPNILSFPAVASFHYLHLGGPSVANHSLLLFAMDSLSGLEVDC